MVTLLQQLAGGLLTLIFGVLAFRVARGTRRHPADRPLLAWSVVATYFLITGPVAVVHAALSPFAVSAGAESRLYVLLVEWGGPANVGRALGALAFAGLVLYAQTSGGRGAPGAARVAPPLIAAATVGGTVLAHGTRFAAMPGLATTLAVLSAAMAMVLLSALLLALTRDGMDEILWLALTAYTLKEVLSVSLFSIYAWWGVADGRSAMRMLYWIAIVVTVGMCLAAAWRLRQAAAGRRVPSLFERVRAIRPPTMGWDNIR